jgi:hypothetical protein
LVFNPLLVGRKRDAPRKVAEGYDWDKSKEADRKTVSLKNFAKDWLKVRPPSLS